jgi:hypothetical protein
VKSRDTRYRRENYDSQESIGRTNATSHRRSAGRHQSAFPEAEFEVHLGGHPEGIYIDAYTKAEDWFAVLDRIDDRMLGLCVEEGLGIYVAPQLKAEP